MRALSSLRVLELSGGVAGEYCGKLLADFGAEVIKIETPGVGSETRRKAPFAVDAQGGENSGLFAYLNTNKRSVALDLEGPSGRSILQRLIERIDVIIDDHAPGYLETLGIEPMRCGEDATGRIVCCITPFGYDAPADLHKAYSLNVFHSSGWGYHSPSPHDPATPPLQGPGRFVADYESGLSAALAVTAALYWREDSGRGQFIDVSQQECLAALSDYVLGQMVDGAMDVSKRRSAFDLGGPATFFRCADGYVYLFISEPGHWKGLSTLMGDPPWMREFPERWLELHLTPERIERCRTHVAQWMLDQRRMDVVARAQELGIPLASVNTAADIFESPQMQSRGFFKQIDHPVLGRRDYPTVPYRLSATPAGIRSPAPLLGQHTEQVLARWLSGQLASGQSEEKQRA